MVQVQGVDGTQSHLQAINFSRAVVFELAAVTEGHGGKAKCQIPERLLSGG